MYTLTASFAHATLQLTSPYVKKHVWTLEWKNRYNLDHRPSKDNARQHKLELKYGLTEWWELEVAGKWENTPHRGNDYTVTDIETKLRFTEPGDYWIDVGADFTYNIGHGYGRADNVSAKLLLQHNHGDFQHTLNAHLARDIGDYRADDAALDIAWRTTYPLGDNLRIGAEYYGDLGDLDSIPDYSGQAHRIGPSVYGKIHAVAYEFAPLIGISHAAEDVLLKLHFKYNF